MSRPITLRTLIDYKQKGEKFSCLTAYDATFAHVVSQAGVDVILVGDSLGMVLQGHDSTLPVSIEDMLYHVEGVKRGNINSLIMADMPFNTYSDPVTATENAGHLMQAGANVVKLEGKAWLAPTLTALAQSGIPTCAHLGLTPQFVNVFGGYKVQGKTEDAAIEMIENAQLLAHAGASMLLLECVPAELAAAITETVDIPVIGIGAGVDTDGQVLVLHDMLGITLGKPAKFVKNFLADTNSIFNAIVAYDQAVKSKQFPTDAHTFI